MINIYLFDFILKEQLVIYYKCLLVTCLIILTPTLANFILTNRNRQDKLGINLVEKINLVKGKMNQLVIVLIKGH